MQSLIKSSGKKQNLIQNQNRTRLRIQRLRKTVSLLGEPDIISVTKIKSTSSFFYKDKKVQQTTEYFINGIIFPTTAHFSSYISSKYQNSEPKQNNLVALRAKLIMFDVLFQVQKAFQEKDVCVEINIPGSLEIKVFNLSGQPLHSSPQDYERAYLSSYLRSLMPMNYPSIVLSPYIYKLQFHKEVLKKLIPFCFEKQIIFYSSSLRQLTYQIRAIFTLQLEEQYRGNFALQIILYFITKNKMWNLLDFAIAEIQRISQFLQLKDFQHLKNRVLFLKKDYPKILKYSSELLMSNSNLNEWKELQIQCLYKLKNFKLVKVLGGHLIRSGGSHRKIYEIICMSYLQTKDFANFLKTLNTILTLHSEEQVYIEEVSHKTKRLYVMDISFNKGQTISAYPQLCFQFDNSFLNRQNKLINFKQSNQNGILAEIITFINRIDLSLEQVQKQDANSLAGLTTYFNLLAKFEKLKGWSEVTKYRGDCFWLQTDFKTQPEEFLDYSKQKEPTHMASSALNKNLKQKSEVVAFSSSQSKAASFSSSSFQVQNQFQRQQFQQVQFEHESDDEDDFSEKSDEEINQISPCSKRVTNNANTARKKFVQLKETLTQSYIKTLCSVSLQKLFVSLYEDLKLQIEVEKWVTKINFAKVGQEPVQKRQLIAILFLKKAFLHLKLSRYKKCEESLKQARKVSQTPLILLVSSYQLIHLYMHNNSMKGAEFYIVDLIKIFKVYGIAKFDVVPEWAQEIINYVVDVQGINILRKLSGALKDLLLKWLRNSQSQSFLEKKDTNNKTSTFYRIPQ